MAAQPSPQRWVLVLERDQRDYILALLTAHQEQLDEEASPDDFDTRITNRDLIRQLIAGERPTR